VREFSALDAAVERFGYLSIVDEIAQQSAIRRRSTKLSSSPPPQKAWGSSQAPSDPVIV